MGLNRNYIGTEYKSEIDICGEDVIAYASAIGAQNLKYINNNEHSDIAPACFCVTYELPFIYKILEDSNIHGGEEQRQKNMLMLVHGDQYLKFYNPISSGDKITFKAEISDIEDKGSGEVLKIHLLSINQDGDKVVESDWGLFIRGIGSGKRPESRGLKPESASDHQEILFRHSIKIPLDITHKYSKASNDMNPIHLDNEVAKRAGLPGIVVHGLCTMAMTSEGIIKSYLDNNSNDLVSLGVRFSAPVFPGDELEIEGSKTSQESKLAFHVVRKSDGIKVIRDGTLEVKI